MTTSSSGYAVLEKAMERASMGLIVGLQIARAIARERGESMWLFVYVTDDPGPALGKDAEVVYLVEPGGQIGAWFPTPSQRSTMKACPNDLHWKLGRFGHDAKQARA